MNSSRVTSHKMIVRDHPSPIDDQSEEFKVNLFFLRPDIGITSLIAHGQRVFIVRFKLVSQLNDILRRFHARDLEPKQISFIQSYSSEITLRPGDLERVKLINVNNYSS